MAQTETVEKGATLASKVPIEFLPFMCENAPSFKDLDKAAGLMPSAGIKHKQREIWKMAPKKDAKGNPVRDDDGKMIMVKVVTRNAKTVTVKNENGLVSRTSSGAVEPMDFTDVLEIIALLENH